MLQGGFVLSYLFYPTKGYIQDGMLAFVKFGDLLINE
jgi:hypothetical protein